MWSVLKQKTADLRSFLLRRWRSLGKDIQESNHLRWGLSIFAVYLVLSMLVGIYWSYGEPDLFSVRERARIELGELEGEAGVEADAKELVPGTITTAALITVIDTMLNKPGGYLTNDITPPGIWLDNIPAWEFGVLVQSRDMAKAMREAFSRSQSQSLEDEHLILAEPHLNFDSDSWMLPDTEGMYQEGIGYLRNYLQRLGHNQEPRAQFYPRADNLRYWLATVGTRLGNLSQRLSASVGQKHLQEYPGAESVAGSSGKKPSEFYSKTAWNEIDDVFFEARGSAWALIHFLRAAEIDFAVALKDKEALVSLQQIIRELEATQQNVYSPIILNGSGFGILTNHSLVMASYISRANAAMIDLQELLTRG